MEYTLGNKKQQLEYNIQEKISSSQLVLNHIPFTEEKKNSSNEKEKINKIENEKKQKKKFYLQLKCDKAYSGLTHFYANNLNIMKF